MLVRPGVPGQACGPGGGGSSYLVAAVLVEQYQHHGHHYDDADHDGGVQDRVEGPLAHRFCVLREGGVDAGHQQQEHSYTIV